MDSEYYSTVYPWFEKCGIISHIRTHLRQNLITALKNKDASLAKDHGKPKPAKQYIYDLLIAEYLFNFNYAYTLSVFASEAPLLVNFHNYVSNSTDNTEERNKQKLQNDYISHTLETIGIKPSEPKGQYIVSEYVNSDLPLLLCILKYITSLSVNLNEKVDTYTDKPLNNVYTQTEFSKTDLSEMNKLLIAKKKICRQKELFDAYLREKEIKLKEQAVAMEQQVSLLNDKLEQIQHLLHSVTLKERHLIEKQQCHEQSIQKKEMELTLKQNLLSQEADRLQKERECCKKFELNLKKLQEELVKVQRELPRGGICSTISVKDVHVQTDCESYTSKINEVANLQKEKHELANLAQEQQTRIEHLTLRAVQLSRQLEEINLLKSSSVEVSTTALRTGNVTMVISESSSTEDILQDARMRLKRLEKESQKANQYYYNCIATSP